MQWTRRENNCDAEVAAILHKYKARNKIAVFGAGIKGRTLAILLKSYDIFGGFIDNDDNKQRDGFDGECVWSVDKYIAEYPNDWIVIAATEKHIEEISLQLETLGKREGSNFWGYSVFVQRIFPIISFYIFGKLYVAMVQISVTERCTLRCRMCAHGCNYVPMFTNDMLLDDVKRSVDYFFENVDVVKEFGLIGGEPLLYAKLAEVIEYIGKHYRKQIVIFSITTNGTILPNDTVLSLCKIYNITFRISDYSATLPELRERYELLYKRLQGVNTIIWKTDVVDSWYDYGFKSVDHGDNTEKLMAVFDKCKTPCREIRGNRYYYCIMARSVAENMQKNIGFEDYFDLSGNVDKKDLFEFEMGYLKKGYLEMCRFCRGADVVNYRIPAAEQEKR